MTLFHIAALFLAIGVTPWLISQLLFPHHSWGIVLAGWGPAMITVNVTIPIILHLLAIPITPNSLTLAQGLLAGLIGFIFIGTKRPIPLVMPGIRPNRLLVFSAIFFALLVLPLTHIAGIDTYKWQDMASNMAVEQRISWLIHPLSLLGFTPRSYSSAQPLVLASIQMLGHTGIDWGFYLLSLTFGLTGLAGAWVLGRHLFQSAASAGWLAILYLFSPVFMRYNYWATGRGLLLALFPVYLLILLKLGAALTDKNIALRRSILWLIPVWLFMTGLLMMSHKAGVVGALLIPLLLALSPALALLRGRWGLWGATLLTLAVGLLLANGQPITLAIHLVTRFGWLIPLAILAIAALPNRLTMPPFRAILAAGLGTLILSCTPDMYGALLALPFITIMATLGLEIISGLVHSEEPLRSSRLSFQTFLLDSGYVRLGVILIPAIAIVLNQMRDSPSESVYCAAQFIEQVDPRGPFRIEAPGAARHQIQAYVSGCPRFTMHADDTATIAIHPPPLRTGELAHDARQWIDYLRDVLELRGANTDWYGNGSKVYYITIDGQGTLPSNAKRLFTTGNVSVFE